MPADITPLSLFYCYAHKDQALRDELDTHLTGLRRSGRITIWYDGELIPGQLWEKIIEHRLETADIILLLISPDFIKSDYCYSKEMVRAIERHNAGAAYVIPILLRPVDWSDAPFASLQMLPFDARPVTAWTNQDAAFTNVAYGLRRAISEIFKHRMSALDTASIGDPLVVALDNSSPLFIPSSTPIQKELEHLPFDSTEMLPKPDFKCPNCHRLISNNATICVYCHFVFSSMKNLESHSYLNGSENVYSPAVPKNLYASSTLSADSQALPAQIPQSVVDSDVDHPTMEISPTVFNYYVEDDQVSVLDLNNDFQSITSQIQILEGYLGFTLGADSHLGIKRKYKPNEDNLFAAQYLRSPDSQQIPFGLFVVADGMGGHANGQDASRSVIQTLIDYVLPHLTNSVEIPSKAPRTILLEAVQQANQVLYNENKSLNSNMGTTITVTLIVNNMAYICNVGDSRTYLYRQEEGLRRVTIDHSVAAKLIAAGAIKPDDIYTHPKRNQLYRNLGAKPNVEVDSFQIPLQSNDRLLLCSDGLWDMVRDTEIEDIIKNSSLDSDQVVTTLVHSALNGGGEDNISVIVVSMIEASQHVSHNNLQIVAKPDAVQVPPL